MLLATRVYGQIDKTNGSHYFMRDDEFEWDDVKAAINERDHHVTFEMAHAAFRHLLAIRASIVGIPIPRKDMPGSGWAIADSCSSPTP